MSPKQFKQFSDDYIKLYIDTIRRIVVAEDRSRPFVPSSPSNGVDTVQEGWIAKDPQSIRYGDSKLYLSIQFSLSVLLTVSVGNSP